MNGTWLPVHQSHTWCPWNATLPVRVSAVYEPVLRSVTDFPVWVLRSLIVLGPEKSYCMTVVVGWSLWLAVVTVTATGNRQRPDWTPLNVEIEEPSASPLPANAAATTIAAAAVAITACFVRRCIRSGYSRYALRVRERVLSLLLGAAVATENGDT